MVVICSEPYTNNEYDQHFQIFPFELSDFQKYSIEAIVSGNHTLVTAHTGSGKTLPAEFALQYFKKMGKKVVYTSPIKALSNQKYYDFTNKYPDISFGLFTGDIKTNPCADVLIMTTEILMNYLFSLDNETEELQKDFEFELNIKDDLACVIFDEVHYINDEHRGQTWEQTILMLPENIQMIMLSATIDAPEKFAKWCERGKKEKQVYLSGTHNRVVPLTHYGFLTTNEGVFKKIKDKETQKKIKDIANTFITLKTSKDVFQEEGYLKLKTTTKLFEQNNAFMNRTHVLNSLAKQLKEQEMLPAIAFVFSRKNVEQYANSITTNILEFDTKVPYTIKNECDQIIRKLPNYKEYMNLPEYENLIQLLEKGIGIHHSGMIPILREIVEYMISRKHIKLLFATESFAIGLDCPIRTAVFTSLTKFDGNKMRYLFSHEYSQAAGRAGRRGLDTVGHVIHCNNMFELPSETEYKEILCGKPQSLISKFQISHSVILNLIKNNKKSKNDFIEFVKKSMISQQIKKAISNEEQNLLELEASVEKKRFVVNNLRTPYKSCERYMELVSPNYGIIGTKLSNKQRKEQSREVDTLKCDYKFILQDIQHIEELNKLKDEFLTSTKYIESCRNHIELGISNICLLLEDNKFIQKNDQDYDFTLLGEIASNVAEIHPLIISIILENTDYFEEFDSKEIVGILSIFTDIKVNQDMRSSVPQSNNFKVKNIVKDIQELYTEFLNKEFDYEINSGIDYDNALIFDLVDLIQEWCDFEDEQHCKYFIQTKLADLEVGLGDFAKGLLKLSTISKELMKVCDKQKKASCMYKLSKIEGMVLKFIVTTQSLYV